CFALDQAVRQDEIGGLRAEVGAQAGGPALVLVQRACESRIPGLSQLDLGAAACLDLESAEALAHKQVFELRILLEIVRLVAEACQVERRHGDVDVPALEKLRHVPVQERQYERADV